MMCVMCMQNRNFHVKNWVINFVVFSRNLFSIKNFKFSCLPSNSNRINIEILHIEALFYQYKIQKNRTKVHLEWGNFVCSKSKRNNKQKKIGKMLFITQT